MTCGVSLNRRQTEQMPRLEWDCLDSSETGHRTSRTTKPQTLALPEKFNDVVYPNPASRAQN
jgi:hypothetical protein